MSNNIKFDDLYSYINTPFQNIHDFDHVYFVGDHTESFSTRAQYIANALPNFSGVALFTISSDKRMRISNQIKNNSNWKFIFIDELKKINKIKKVLIICFNDNITGKLISSSLNSGNITVKDFLYAMDQLDQIHTYKSIREERAFIVDNLNRFQKLFNILEDTISRATLFARLKTYLTLDRVELLKINWPHVFINNNDQINGILIRKNEIFVDAGAAFGDTVSYFYHQSRGQYKEIHAFEPDSEFIVPLRNLCTYLPNTSCYHLGLGDKNENLNFFEASENRYGSNFLENSTVSQIKKSGVKVQRLDDLLEAPTLIKIDVEGFESKVINGSKRIISEHTPNMNISAYHYPADLLDIYESVNSIHQYSNVCIRHYSANLFDTCLNFSDIQKFQ